MIKTLHNFLLPVLFLLPGLSSTGQVFGSFDLKKGLERYPLGSIRSTNDSGVIVGRLDYKGRIELNYSYPKVKIEPYVLGDVSFKDLVLTFEPEKLIRISFMKLYLEKLYVDFEERAKQEFEKIYAYLKAEWKRKGKKKTFLKIKDGMIVSKGYQCNKGDKIMKLSLYEDKNPMYRAYHITLDLELGGYD